MATALHMISSTINSMAIVATDMEMLLRELAPDSSPAMHAIMHLGVANAELGSAEQLLGDVK